MFTEKNKNLKILFVATEAEPFAEVGGLSSVMHSLPRALREIGHEARVFIPRYLSIDNEKYRLQMVHEGLEVPTDNKREPKTLICNVKVFEPESRKGSPVKTYFLENEEYYEQRANVYGYADDPVRWALLSRGVLEFLRTSDWVPDVIVSADWQGGFLPNYLKTTYKNDPILSKIATVFSIHNISYQGMFDHNFVQELDYDDGHSPIPAFEDSRLLKVNGMRRGIMHADMINTVSPSYAKEIMTSGFGEGLDELLRERRSALHGLLNGIDYHVWDPKNDKLIKHHFSPRDLKNRAKNKQLLQDQFGLPIDEKVFLVGVVARLSSQKGFDLLTGIIEPLLNELKMQLIVVGEGDTHLMKFFRDLEEQFPEKVAAHLKYDSILPHQIFAGSDITLIPSRFEPSGLTQMEAMHYGTIPVVRDTGGLSDTVDEFDPDDSTGTGFKFQSFDAISLMAATVRAYENFRHKDTWTKLQKNAMKKDFSWEKSAEQYLNLFQKAIEFHLNEHS